ncbi:MAG: DUF4038 domain-containing protein [Thermoguttaceae bacterium]|nr:DUF4038 domain-containing protein [Thermoguttaceae bacterium]
MLNKRIFLSNTTLLVSLLSLCAVSFAASGNKDVGPEFRGTEPSETEPKDGEPARVETETWIAVDLPFTSNKSYGEGEQVYAQFDVAFTNPASGTSLTIPGFWDGEGTFVARFAPTETGEWDYVTSAPDDPDLDGKTGKVIAKPYSGDLEIYKRGFVKTNGSKRFVYADGTPFFYLGDTHWSLYREEFDSPGPYAGDVGAKSHFKYIVDKRVEQGFTVYQSEPIGTNANLADGELDASDAVAFKMNDRYYQYLAEKGLVHANAEFFFCSSMTKALADDERYLEAISRYWVARYAAYPVMWTLAQEADNDFYRERGDQKFYDSNDNPWVKVAEFIHKYDAYRHPLSCHQENTLYTSVTGAGSSEPSRDNGGKSAFCSEDVSARTGHDWWAAQWGPNVAGQESGRTARDYWESDKVAINYEGKYCNLWTKDAGARMQSWIAMLSGFAGVGYGAADIWLYNGNYDLDTTSNDGLDTITPEDKAVRWSEAVEFESAWQQGVMRRFFESFDWPNLKPDFDDEKIFKSDQAYYVAASVGNETYAIYLYARSKNSGAVLGMDANGSYDAAWFDPRTGETIEIGEIRADAQGTWNAPEKPGADDYALILRKK